MIIISSAFIGINEAAKLKDKCTCTSKMIQMIRQIKIQMNYCVPSVREILQALTEMAEFKPFTFLNKCLESYDECSFDTLWEREVRAAGLPLSKEDVMMLVSFGSGLGTTDLDGQIGLCDSFEEKFKMSLKAYETQRDQKSKLYISAGVLAGIGIGIILI